MAKCKYTLELPGGSSIELPAGFNSLNKSEDLDDAFNSFLTETNENNKQIKQDELIKKLKDKIKIAAISDETVKQILNASKTVPEIYDNLNKLITSFGTYENIGEAIVNYIKKGNIPGQKNKNLSKLMKELQQPRNAEYFQKIGMSGVLSTTNLQDQKDFVYNKHVRNLEFEMSTIVSENLNKFLNALIHKYKETKDFKSNVLYATSDPFVGKAWSDGNIVIYEKDDDLSLFLGLFKREASNLPSDLFADDIAKLNEELVKIGEKPVDFDPNTFFRGKETSKGITPSILEDLLKLGNNIKIANVIDNIITKVAKSISNNQTLPAAIKKLFWQLSPESYGKGKIAKQLADQKFIDSEIEIDLNYKSSYLPFMEMTSDQRNLNFGLQESLINKSFDEINSELIPYKDIVLFPLEGNKNGINIFGLVTGVYQRPDGVEIYGIYKNQFGKVETLNHLFKTSEPINYRKRENPIDPIDPNDVVVPVKGALIVSDTKLPQSLTKRLLRKGDLIGTKLVLGVYPGYVTVKDTKGKIFNVSYNNIDNIQSSRALEELQVESKIKAGQYVQINDGNDLSEGDYFLFKKPDEKSFYKRIVYADSENVYSIVTGENGSVILPTKREGLTGLKNTFDKLTPEEITTIQNEQNSIGRSSATMSYFTNPDSAREGDLFYYEEDGIKRYGKVLANGKVLVLSGDSLTNKLVTSLDKIINPQFFTDRNISSNYSLFNIRANSNALSFKSEPESDLDVEAVYVVPRGTNLDTLVLLPNGYANKGGYKAKEFVTKDDLDITPQMMKRLGFLSNTKPFFKKESSNSVRYEKNLDSLTWVKYFNELDYDTKNELDILKPGVYFSTFRNDTQIDFNIYRIISVDNNIVTAQLNKLSPEGKVITTEVQFDKDTLLNKNKGSNGIARLYVQNGNTKLGAVLKEVNALKQDRDITNQAINDLIVKMKKFISGLDIDVKLVDPKEGNFTNGQKAKIETNEDGKVSILINNTIGQEEDVIHEFLHLFLTPLRYQSPEIYHELIHSVVKDNSLNVTDAEEEFVKYISPKMIEKEDFVEDFKDLNSLVSGLHKMLNIVNPDFEVSYNPIDILNTRLTSLFDINKTKNDHELYNETMVTLEPMIREWMKSNNINLKCN